MRMLCWDLSQARRCIPLPSAIHRLAVVEAKRSRFPSGVVHGKIQYTLGICRYVFSEVSANSPHGSQTPRSPGSWFVIEGRAGQDGLNDGSFVEGGMSACGRGPSKPLYSLKGWDAEMKDSRAHYVERMDTPLTRLSGSAGLADAEAASWKACGFGIALTVYRAGR